MEMVIFFQSQLQKSDSVTDWVTLNSRSLDKKVKELTGLISKSEKQSGPQ